MLQYSQFRTVLEPVCPVEGWVCTLKPKSEDTNDCTSGSPESGRNTDDNDDNEDDVKEEEEECALHK